MITAILMMAGNSARMQMNEKKVYLPLGDKMVYEYSLEKFLKFGFEVVCVIKEEDLDKLNKYASQIKIVYGGQTRQESVYNGLVAASGDYVLIHDAARPFITDRIINDCISAIAEKKAFLVNIPSKDSAYLKEPFQAINRENIALAQTPQGGNRLELINCHQKAIKENFPVTDDVSLILKFGNSSVKLISGDEINFKITTQLDYIMAKEFVKNV